MSAALAGSPRVPSRAITTPSPSKQSRSLACVSCQHRKVKCDRLSPCSRCLKSGVQCIPADAVPRVRKKRFAERQLLDRLRQYEDLLRQHNILHDPLQDHEADPDAAQEASSTSAATPATTSTGSPRAVRPRPQEAKNIWQAMNQTNDYRQHGGASGDEDVNTQPDIVRNVVVQNAYEEMYKDSDHLLFGARKEKLDLATLHPPSSRIFKYWQLFLDNANPLLRVIHTPTFQSHLVDAASDLSAVSPVMHALLFSIYSMVVHTLDEVTSEEILGSKKQDLLAGHHFACQQALLSCGVLRTIDRESLTALFLYLISTRDQTDPRTISSMLGIAARLAQRMGLHSEASNSKCSPFEEEMRRRLWWALVMFDSRISDMAGNKAAILLTPVWDCKTPSDVDDSQLWPDMLHQPVPSTSPSDAIYVTVRSEIDDFIRNSGFYLDFTNPILKPLATVSDNNLPALDKHIEHDILQHCTLEKPIHYMAVWSARGLLAKNQLFHYYSQLSEATSPPTDTQRDQALSYCLRMLDADTKLMTAPVTKRYRWLVQFFFPFPAYLHIIQDIRRRPNTTHTLECWETMSKNYEARFLDTEPQVGLFHRLIAKLIVQTWLNTKALDHAPFVSPTIPGIVAHVARKLGVSDLSQPTEAVISSSGDGIGSQESPAMATGSNSRPNDQDASWQSLSNFVDMSEYAMDFSLDAYDWNAFDVNSLFAPS